MAFENGALFRCTLHARSPSEQEIVNVFHYNFEGDLGSQATKESVCQELADRLRDDLELPFRALLPTDWNMQPVIVAEERDPQNPTAARISRQAVPGSSAGTRLLTDEPLPTACARVYTLSTGFVGRRFRGRKFIGGLAQQQDFGAARNNWDPPAAGNFAFLADALIDAVPVEPDLVTGPDPSVTFWCVYSRTQRAANLDPYAERVTGTTPRDTIFWLRSRQIGE